MSIKHLWTSNCWASWVHYVFKETLLKKPSNCSYRRQHTHRLSSCWETSTTLTSDGKAAQKGNQKTPGIHCGYLLQPGNRQPYQRGCKTGPDGEQCKWGSWWHQDWRQRGLQWSCTSGIHSPEGYRSMQMDKAFLKFPPTRKVERKQQRIRSMNNKVRNASCVCFVAISLPEKPRWCWVYFCLSLGQYVPKQISQHTGGLLIFWTILYVVTWIRPHSITCLIKSPVEDWCKPFSHDESHCVTEIRIQFPILSNFFMGFILEGDVRRQRRKKKKLLYFLLRIFWILCHGEVVHSNRPFSEGIYLYAHFFSSKHVVKLESMIEFNLTLEIM